MKAIDEINMMVKQAYGVNPPEPSAVRLPDPPEVTPHMETPTNIAAVTSNSSTNSPAANAARNSSGLTLKEIFAKYKPPMSRGVRPPKNIGLTIDEIIKKYLPSSKAH